MAHCYTECVWLVFTTYHFALNTVGREIVRLPVVSGSFYPGNKAALIEELGRLVDAKAERKKVLGLISPHAGYVYSGRVMGSVFSGIVVPDTVVILAPNHTGLGSPFSIWPEGCWRTPLGKVPTDVELVQKIIGSCDLVKIDQEAHVREHSAEVLLPFLQYLNPLVKIAVIVIRSNRYKDLKVFGKSIGEVLLKIRRNALVIASSDMTHYENQKSANRKDTLAITEIVALREEGLYRVVQEHNITMCGIAPAISMLICSKERAATKAELIGYETSGKVSGDYDQVVGYAGIIVE
ncbi:MAG: AmmeMemoRadiSam system protein B [Candidatus Scalindua sp. SCAELEC01]|nr:AmmeMemoRadiSam system protein B [Planctomycetota bacterium]RZV74442.1 MAG: AmmeMemoRadiSam system protein B [Candidatus Scalindua sp. SCAELEC01]